MYYTKGKVKKRAISLILAFAMIFSLGSNQIVQASEIDKSVESAEEGKTEVSGESADSKAETAEKKTQEETSATAEQALVQYVYVEKKTVATPGEQNIVVALQEGITVESATLHMLKADGTVVDQQMKTVNDGAVLFNFEFLDESQNGIYTLDSFSYVQNGVEETIDFSELGIADSKFGVNEECDTNPDEVIEEVVEEASSATEVTVSVLDENGNSETADEEQITQAIENAVEQGADPQSEAASRAVKTSNKVVVLDPGHGGKDGGATGNGLVEKNLNLTIAKYCKEELEQYPGVTVKMTRTKDVFVDLEERVAIAKSYGADYFVSIHINSGGGIGAEVWYPNKNYRPSYGTEGKKLADQIMKQLADLGLVNRGTKYKSTVEDKYPDGTVQDWYSVIRNSKLYGFPGIIIEHGFIDNAQDAAFMSKDSNLKKLGIADATGIAEYLNVSKSNNWTNDGNGWKYKDDDGNYFKGGWYTIGNNQYYFDEDGYRQTGWLTLKGEKYYLGSDGKLITGWYTIGSSRYYFNPDKAGAMSTGWLNYKNKWYYLDKEGKKIKGLQTIEGLKYYIDGSKGRITGWYTVGNSRYYFDPDNSGAAAIGWFNYKGKTFYADSTGNKLKGLQTIQGSKYYIDGSSGLVTGWKTISGVRYYFDPSDKGAAVTGWLNYKGKLYYFNSNGKKLTGWVNTDKGKYYVTGSNGALRGWNTVSSTRYYFDESTGKMKTGWLEWNNKKYYLQENGKKVTGWYTVGDKRYYFDSYGRMQKGWITYKSKKFYLDEDGVKQSGWLTLNEKKYYVDSSKGMYTGQHYINGTKYIFDKNGVLLSAKLTTIMGNSLLGNKEQAVTKMVNMYNSSKEKYPATELSKGGASTIKAFCEIIYDEATAEGVKPEVVFGQAMLETGYLQFGGDVKISQYNFSGLGATGNGASGNSFKNVRTGLRAQVQHLKAYASSKPLVNGCVDERFNLVERESAPYVEWLGIQENPKHKGWASGANYGYSIVKNYIEPMYN